MMMWLRLKAERCSSWLSAGAQVCNWVKKLRDGNDEEKCGRQALKSANWSRNAGHKTRWSKIQQKMQLMGCNITSCYIFVFDILTKKKKIYIIAKFIDTKFTLRRLTNGQ